MDVASSDNVGKLETEADDVMNGLKEKVDAAVD